MKKLILCLCLCSVVGLKAQNVKCLNDQVSVTKQAGWADKGNYDTYCAFGKWVNTTDYHAGLYKRTSASPNVSTLAEDVLNGIRTQSGVKNVQVISRGFYDGNPLADYFIELTYSKDFRVAHDLRTLYVHKMIYAFAKNSEISTPYYAEATTSTELPANTATTQFNEERPKFTAFLNTIRFPVSITNPKQPTGTHPGVVKIPQEGISLPKKPIPVPPRRGN
ncbi:MAG: hypothetical protein J0L94_16125 [Rhodothermia bacterium]|nr:hypothetical protein [Rhodothermia bacterium]